MCSGSVILDNSLGTTLDLLAHPLKPHPGLKSETWATRPTDDATPPCKLSSFAFAVPHSLQTVSFSNVSLWGFTPTKPRSQKRDLGHAL